MNDVLKQMLTTSDRAGIGSQTISVLPNLLFFFFFLSEKNIQLSLLQYFLQIMKGGWVQLAETQIRAALQDRRGRMINEDSHWPCSHMHQSGSISASQGYRPVRCWLCFQEEKEPQSNVNCATTEFDLWLYNIYCPESSPSFRWHVN